MAKKSPESNEYYSQLLIYPKKRNFLYFLCTVFAAAMTFAIFQYNTDNFSQRDILITVSVSAVFLCLYPVIEEWEYKPWQSKAIQYEKHYNGSHH